MKLVQAALLTGLTTALLFGTAPDVSAQFIVGVQGTLADVRSVSAGLGGRLGYVQPAGGGNDVRLGIEAAYSYYWPDCIGTECDSSGGQAVLLVSRNFGSGGGAQSYLGLGARYQNVKLDGANPIDDDYWGFLVLFGSSIQTNAAVSPFFEIGWSFMNDISDIWDFTLGARFAIGR